MNALGWLVESRSKIQRLSLDILALVKSSTRDDELKQVVVTLIVGTAFSLWRAVFLTHPSTDRKDTIVNAERYLERVIRDNAITYADDSTMRVWSFGYYLNNAHFRLKEICRLHPEYGRALTASRILEGVETPPRPHHDDMQMWDAHFEALAYLTRKAGEPTST